MAPKAVKKPAAKAPARKAAAPKKAATARTAAPKPKAKAAPKATAKTSVTAGKAVTQSALMQMLADQTGLTKAEAKRIIDSYCDLAKSLVMKGAKVKIGDIGMIMIRARKARMGRNPQTGAPVKIKASKKLAFRQSATMRDAVK